MTRAQQQIGRPPILTEHQEQVGFVQQVKLEFRHDKTFIPELFFSVPNGMVIGGKNRFALYAKYEAEGLNTGVADILYLQPRGGFSYLAIEMKRSDKRNVKDGGLTPDQKHFLAEAVNVNAVVSVCYTADEAINEFRRYMEFQC